MATPDPALAIQVRALTKNFGDVCALDGVDLEVPRGTVLGLLGPNGAGKTTTVNILATALQPDGGDAHVLGIDVARDPAKVRGVIGLAGQYAAVDGTLTGRENLALIGTLTHLPRRLIRRRADELLERFGLTDAGDRLARTYSGGMRRRLDLAAALVHQPPVLFLDEPTTGLDPASRNDLWQAVRELVDEGTTVLLTTQYLEEADQLAHRIAVVDHGRVITEGTAVELKRRLGATMVELVFADASVASLRFLDYGPALNACKRLQALNRYYTCQDADLDRYERDGKPQTMFVFGREVDYSAIPDFQRRHFAFTHGKGVVMAPVNRIDSSGRPDFVVSGLPVTGLEEPLKKPEIYFGAQPGMPWAIVNTDQPDGFSNTVPDTWKGAGIPVDDHKLAITLSLGGLPYVGGGRRLWNALERVQTADSRLLIHRDMTARLARLAPFLVPDADPYFVVADGQMWVMMNAYTMTDRYPYSARYGGRNYQRHAVTAVMNASSGETAMYIMTPDDPIIRTWQKVYPSLFTERDEMPEGLAAHLRYGEDLFAYQAAAMGRFHVTDVDQFFNNDDAWASTVETIGPGAEGTRIPSPARYTYARLPGAADERFMLMRYFKPATVGRGIGFSAWLAADSDPQRFGELSVLRFVPDGPSPLDSVDTFASNVGRDPELSAQIGVRTDQILRGNTIVVPMGRGLLYVQPLYLDTSADSLPTLWQVVVSLGDGRIFYAPTFRDALNKALAGQVAPDGDGDGNALPADLREVVRQAAAAYEAYQVAWAAGRYEDAATELRRFERIMAHAEELADRSG
jgi:daunorubicin resistance ABC transporter ATP-binding subunit